MAVHFKENKDQISVKVIITGIVVIGILVTSLIIYLLDSNSSKIEESIEQSQTENTSNENVQFESASTEIGKSVNEVANELNTIQENITTSNETNSKTKTNTTSNKKSTNTNTTTTTQNTSTNTVTNTETENTTVDQKEETEEEVKFTVPVKGEVLREFAPDSLVYSDTLEEWITHKGIDIKADKTSVVTASADGTVSAIKNDPRYGLTVIVDHKGGYQTVYANLLTAEFVVQGEEIKAGQTIGTVGNTATFEISDDFHLHFELLKNGEYQNPTNYIEF